MGFFSVGVSSLNRYVALLLVVQKSQAVESQQQYEQEVKKHGQAIDEKNQLREELDRACAKLLEAEAARDAAVQALGYAWAGCVVGCPCFCPLCGC